MNKNVIIGIAAAVVLAGAGAGAYFYFQDEPANPKASNTSNNKTPVFSPKATGDTSFEATYTATTKAGVVTVGTIQIDKNGNSKYTGTADNKEFASYQIDGDYISCTGGTCIQFSGSSDQEAVSSDEYAYSEEDYQAFRESAEYKGRVSCGSESCELWEVPKNAFTTSFYINDAGMIKKLKGERADGTTYEITYEYKDVTITRPENVRSFSIPGQ